LLEPEGNLSVRVSEQHKIYNDFWRRFSQQIREGCCASELYSPQSSMRVCTTIVSRLPRTVSAAIHQVLAPLESEIAHHYNYPIDDYHFTLLDISPIVTDPDFGSLSPDATAAVSKLAEDLAWEVPLRLRIKGLGVFPTTVFAQILDIDGRVTDLRNRVTLILERETSAILRPPLAPGLIFSNVIRFCTTPKQAIINLVSTIREVPEIEFEAADFEVVSTDKALTRSATVLHEQIHLRGISCDHAHQLTHGYDPSVS
jgi:hypothetical protein